METLPTEVLSPASLTLLSILAGGIITAVTQMLKKWSPIQFHPMLIVAALSLVGGVGYAFAQAQGIWATIAQHSTVAFVAAVAIYEVLKNVLGGRGDN